MTKKQKRAIERIKKLRGRKRMRAARICINMSQRELARRCGIGNVTICRIENGIVENPNIGTLKAIARVLRVPLAEIA